MVLRRSCARNCSGLRACTLMHRQTYLLVDIMEKLAMVWLNRRGAGKTTSGAMQNHSHMESSLASTEPLSAIPPSKAAKPARSRGMDTKLLWHAYHSCRPTWPRQLGTQRDRLPLLPWCRSAISARAQETEPGVHARPHAACDVEQDALQESIYEFCAEMNCSW